MILILFSKFLGSEIESYSHLSLKVMTAWQRQRPDQHWACDSLPGNGSAWRKWIDELRWAKQIGNSYCTIATVVNTQNSRQSGHWLVSKLATPPPAQLHSAKFPFLSSLSRGAIVRFSESVSETSCWTWDTRECLKLTDLVLTRGCYPSNLARSLNEEGLWVLQTLSKI